LRNLVGQTSYGSSFIKFALPLTTSLIFRSYLSSSPQNYSNMLSILALLFMAASAVPVYVVSKDAPFTIELPANPSTGYEWTFVNQKGPDGGLWIRSCSSSADPWMIS
jgi:hypothetical protein